GDCPLLKARMAWISSAGLRPMSLGTGETPARFAGWQPEQELAPGGASAGPARAAPNGSKHASNAAAEARSSTSTLLIQGEGAATPIERAGGIAAPDDQAVRRSWFISGTERIRLP